MAQCQADKLHPAAAEKAVTADEQRIGPLAHDSGEGRIDLIPGAGFKYLDLQTHRSGCGTPVSHCYFGVGDIGWIDEHS